MNSDKTNEEDRQSIEALEELLTQYKDRNYKQSIFVDRFDEVAGLVSKLSPEC